MVVGILIVLSLLVIFSKNPIHSVVSLVLVCLNVINILLVYGIEYLGVILLLVYIGAIAVLFLFVVMLVNIRMAEKLSSKLSYLPLGLVIGSILFIELALSMEGSIKVGLIEYNEWVQYILGVSSIELIGLGLYTVYMDGVIICGIILLIGIIGSLSITLKSRERILFREKIVIKEDR